MGNQYLVRPVMEENDVLKVGGATRTHQTFLTVGCSAHVQQLITF